ncbi:uncharacterized protein LOC126266013 [Aethina tumida]|uniref:uncharacterized protein LOC126266013 n=1 Tax=Aethina tumida TaxID=116153 RepID=UPI002147B9E8|nr:uncharacterized protein LOC126266013 [Aethina tumida]
MWNISNGNGLSPWMGAFEQKRSFHGLASRPTPMSILPNKSFTNPNFVNNITTSTTMMSSYERTPPDVLENGNRGLVETIKQSCPEIMKPLKSENKNSRKSRRRKISERKNKDNSNRNIGIEEDMETEFEQADENVISKSMSSPEPLHLSDFIPVTCVDEVDHCFSIFSFPAPPSSPPPSSPPPPSLSCSNNGYYDSCKEAARTRLPSACESEDSFIMFEPGSDAECDFDDSSSSTSGDESETDEESEVDSEWDSSESVVPKKKVRFADEESLCSVHPMVQWAYAYQKARKGPWEAYARDRERFKRRISDASRLLDPVLKPEHRRTVFTSRFQE